MSNGPPSLHYGEASASLTHRQDKSRRSVSEGGWWRGAIFYQIYPRSFLDTKNQGIGTLPGITQKLPYIADLGVDALWICPFYKSPMEDYGYDVADYRDIDPLFGTLKDFDALMEKAGKHNIKIIIDLVLSHTSNAHPWFLESRQGKDNDKSNYYVWADEAVDGSPPNNWLSVFGGPAWSFDATRGQYYLHNFLPSQPDLNFHTPAVQKEALDIAKFWLDRGVNGFRLDVVNFYFHDQMLRNNPPRTSGTKYATQFEGEDPYSAQQHIFDKSRPENLEFLREFRKLMDQYDGIFTIGEIGDDHPYERAAEYTQEGLYLHSAYNTHLMSGTHKDLTPELLQDPISNFHKYGPDSWPSWAFTNHDVVRAASRWLPDDDGFGHNPEFSKMLIGLIGCLHGTMFLYQGEELGLPEAKLEYQDLHDPWGKSLWPSWQGRDGCRTPMPWDESENAGFSPAKPWLPIPESHKKLCVSNQESDKNSCLNFTREFLKFRKNHEVFRLGNIQFLEMASIQNICFERNYKDKKIFCQFYLGGDKEKLTNIRKDQILFENRLTDNLELKPFGFVIAQI